MRLRPEQWVLLDILGVALFLLGLQLQHNLSFPSLRREETRPAVPAAQPAEAAGGSGPADTAAAPGSPGSPASAAVRPETAPQSAPAAALGAAVAQTVLSASAEPPPPASDAPLLAVRLEPPAALPQQPVRVTIRIESAAAVSEVFFDLRYDPRLLAPGTGPNQALEALASAGVPAELQVQIPEPGRLVALLRRPAPAAAAPTTGDLCLFQFIALEKGGTAVRVERAGVRGAAGDLIGARGSEAPVEVR